MVQGWISTQCFEKQIVEFFDVGPTGIEPSGYAGSCGVFRSILCLI